MENVNDVNEELIDASIDRDLEKVKECLKNGADINIRSNIEWTPLLCVTHFNNLEIAKYLIEKGADVNAKETLQEHWTPLLSATINDIENDKVKQEIIRLLINNGADVNAKNKYERTALDYAKNKEIVSLLKPKMQIKPKVKAKTKQQSKSNNFEREV